MTITQLGHVCALLGLINYVILRAARSHLASYPALQERIVGALLKLLLIGDCTHLAFTFWVLGKDARNVRSWSTTLWVVVLSGASLLIPRLCWYVGVGRYVHVRDGQDTQRTMAVQTAKRI
jgi:hypothetical protein